MSLYAAYCPVCGWLTLPTTYPVAFWACVDHIELDKAADHQPHAVQVGERTKLAMIPQTKQNMKAGNR